jgi:septal ring factor EnvC (AmiA/AmiB activator)
MKAVRLILLAGLASLAFLAAAQRPSKDEIAAHQKDLADVEKRMRGVEQDLEAQRGKRESLVAELAKLERSIGDLAVAGRQLDAMVDEQKRALADLEQRLATERRALQTERTVLRRLLRSAYISGRADRLQLLLNQDDASRVSRVMAYYGYLNRYRLTRITEIQTRERKLAPLARDAANEAARLSALAARQAETREHLSAARGERERLLSKLDRTIATDQERFQGLKADAEGLRQLIEQLERQAKALPEADIKEEGITKRRGALPWPLAGGKVVYHFGQPKGAGAQHWDGVVIAGPEGQAVHAISGGRVVYANWLRGFGLLLIIEHDDGYMSLYGYNQALLKEPGEWVSAGDVIALSGSSGGQRLPGLYFAIRHHGRPVDPESWCRTDSRIGAKYRAGGYYPFCPLDALLSVTGPIDGACTDSTSRRDNRRPKRLWPNAFQTDTSKAHPLELSHRETLFPTRT